MKIHRGDLMAKRPNVESGTRPVVSAFLRYGVMISAIVLLAGLGLLLVRRGFHASVFMPTVRAPESTNLNSLRAILHQLLPPKSEAVLESGILLLIVMPVFAVGTSAISFAIEGGWLYFVIAALVFVVLTLGFAIGRAGTL